MSFKSLPASATPLRLDSAASGFMSFLEPQDVGGSPILIISVAATRDDFGRHNDSPRPPIALVADGANPFTVPEAPSAVTIFKGTEEVASASLTVEEPGIYQVVISVVSPVSIWDVRV